MTSVTNSTNSSAEVKTSVADGAAPRLEPRYSGQPDPSAPRLEPRYSVADGAGPRLEPRYSDSTIGRQAWHAVLCKFLYQADLNFVSELLLGGQISRPEPGQERQFEELLLREALRNPMTRRPETLVLLFRFGFSPARALEVIQDVSVSFDSSARIQQTELVGFLRPVLAGLGKRAFLRQLSFVWVLSRVRREGSVPLVQFLLDEAGLKVSKVNSAGYTLLFAAGELDAIELFSFLLDRGADPFHTVQSNALTSGARRYQANVLQLLVAKGSVRCLEEALRRGFRLDVESRRRSSRLSAMALPLPELPILGYLLPLREITPQNQRVIELVLGDTEDLTRTVVWTHQAKTARELYRSRVLRKTALETLPDRILDKVTVRLRETCLGELFPCDGGHLQLLREIARYLV